MAQTKLVARIVADQCRRQMQARPRPSGGTGKKRPGWHAQRDKMFKIKKFINNPKNVDIKHHGQVIRKWLNEEEQYILAIVQAYIK